MQYKKREPASNSKNSTGSKQKSMLRVQQLPKIVNIFTQKQLEEAAAFNMLRPYLGHIIPTRYLKLKSGHKIACPPKNAMEITHCMFNIPADAAGVAPQKNKKKRDPRKKFEKIIKRIDTAKSPSDEDIIAMAKTQADSQIYISKMDYDGSRFTFPGFCKGNARYNYKLQQKAIADAKETAEEYPYIYFLTLTISPKLVNWSRTRAFHEFHADLKKYMKKIKRKYKVQWSRVTEVTNRGFPHEHAIIFSKEPLVDTRNTKDKKKRITQGNLYSFLKKNWTLGRIDLRIAENENIAGYMAKYMSKANFCEFNEKDVKGKKLTKEQRKAYMTTYMPCAYGYKAYRTSWTKKEKQKAGGEEILQQIEGKENNSQSKERLLEKFDEDRPVIGLTEQVAVIQAAVQRTASLISFSIKENIACKGMLSILKKTNEKPVTREMLGHDNGKMPKGVEEGALTEVCRGCSGCAFLQSILENKEKWENDPISMLASPFISEEEFDEMLEKEIEDAELREEWEEIRQNIPKYGVLTNKQVEEFKEMYRGLEKLGEEIRPDTCRAVLVHMQDENLVKHHKFNYVNMDFTRFANRKFEYDSFLWKMRKIEEAKSFNQG